VFNDWGFDTLKRKLEGLYTMIILESGLRLIDMGNSPLDPLLDPPLSCGNLAPITPSMSICSRRYIYFIIFDIQCLHITSSGPQPYIIFTLYIAKPGIKNGDVTFPSPYKLHGD
jgi:hypothetical protein